VDSRSKRIQEILAVTPNFLTGFALSKDQRSLYLSIHTAEADIWVVTLE
jgi:hypothetical protein